MKKLFVFAASVLLSALLAIGALAAEKTVYLASGGDDAKDGTSYKNAVKTVEQAYKLIGDNDGKIVVCGFMNFGTGYTLPKHEGKVTFTATDGVYRYATGKIAFSQDITLSGDTVFERIGIAPSGTACIAAAGNNLTMGKDVDVDGSLVLLAGFNVLKGDKKEDVSFSNDVRIDVLDGEYLFIRGGNRRADGAAPFGTVSGNVTINISGGTFTSRDDSVHLSAAAGMNDQTGNVTLNILGGEFWGSLFAVGRAGTNELAYDPHVSGAITINIVDGIVGGKRIDENQDDTIGFSGNYTLNLIGGKYPLVESIKGGDSAKLTVDTSLKEEKTTVTDTFKNPLRGGADPWIIYKDGYYYMTTVIGVSVMCFKSPTINGLAYAEGVAIWTAPKGDAVNDTNKMYSAEIWSPELHYVEESEFGKEYAGWWLYFSADDGDNVNHRLYTVRALTDDACGEYGSPVTGEFNIPVKMVVDNDETWAIGQSLLRANGSTYLTWTSESGRGTAEHKQDIRIAKLQNPYTVIGAGNIICFAEYDWESKGYAYNANTGVSYPKVVEGATAVYGENGEIIIVYSASGYWTNFYCLSTLVLKEGGDPLSKNAWIKAEEPIFSHQNGVFGPGHAAYVTDAGGNRWMMYHGYLDGKRTGRYVFVQPYTLNGTTFDMNGGPYSPDTVFSIVNEATSITAAINGFGIK